MSVAAVVLGAGAGIRLGASVPKALVEVGGRSLLHWSVGALASAPSVDAVHCVVPAGYEPALDPLRAAWGALGRLLEAIPGAGPVRMLADDQDRDQPEDHPGGAQ